jgi:hypothetical protein
MKPGIQTPNSGCRSKNGELKMLYYVVACHVEQTNFSHVDTNMCFLASRNPLRNGKRIFVPTEDFQEIKEGQEIPAGKSVSAHL